ncbi:hypothetical protein PM10SUCC1_00750 [Propionigenium maris DSM 9537]|uniref:Mechanosensitive ion channel MscS domain-containing protein n=1 Tax=Propionigenium maris DSM 9537 TaxID=1123000 RepID=A0A9W6LM58_9FUSO|nr:mechanosensitive ion channel domain-containing protein [Propionigenium maris]GLI54560.1 hypothetical protein PM10SUCC1_00750 [Propionigenium maris DSM 9537]
MGSVHEINMFSTELNTIDSKRVIIPNNIITSTEVTNFHSWISISIRWIHN